MASDLSKYVGNALLRWMTGTAMPTALTNTYAALFNGDPKAAGTEVTTTINASGRVAIDWDAVAADGADNSMSNEAVVDFGNAAGGATVTHVAVYDAAASGNLLWSKALAASIVVETGDPVSIAVGDLMATVGE